MHANQLRLRGVALPLFLTVMVLAAGPASAEWFATVKLPYNSPGYLAQWENDPQQIIFTLNNHSAAPATIVFELIAKTDALGEIFHGSCVPFTMVNNSPRAFRTPEVIRWKEIVWNPAVRGSLANPRRVPEGELQICIRVYEWKNGRGAQLVEACEKTNVGYPDVPQPTLPRDDAHVSAASVQFSWQAPEMPTGIMLQYRVDIAELSAGQRAEDAIVHPTYSTVVQANTAMIAWGKPLRRGHDYCWRATALDQYGLPATAHDGNSRLMHFHYDAPDDLETEKFLTRIQKSALANLAPVKSDPVFGPLVAPAVSALSGSASTRAFADASAKLRAAMDSLSETVSPVAIDAIENALALTQFIAEPAAGGIGPYDSLVTLCVVRAMGARPVSSPQTRVSLDSLITQLKALRGSLTTPAALAAATATHHAALALVANGKSESAAWHDRMESMLFTSAAVMRLPWPAGGFLAEAEVHAMQVQRTAPKKSVDQIAALRQQLADAQQQLASAAASSANMDEGKIYDALRRANATAEAARGTWKGSADGLHDFDSIKIAVSASSDAWVNSRHSALGTLYFVVARAQASAGKKAAGDFDKLLTSCLAAIAQPKNVAMTVQVLHDIKHAVQTNAAKGDKAWGLIPVEACDKALVINSFAAGIGDIRASIASVAGSVQDPTAKAAATALGNYCGDIVKRCVTADESSSFFRELATAPVERTVAVDIIRDLREIARLGGASAQAGTAKTEELVVRTVLNPIALAGPDAADVRDAVAKRGLTVSFGSLADKSFAAVQGNALIIDVSLADQPVAAIVPFVAGALESPAVSAQARYAAMKTHRAALKKANGDGWNARADFLIDVSLLGEREITSMLRAMP